MAQLEAFCTKCRETFVPADEDDIEHGVREDGEVCGGLGQITGEWVYTPELEPGPMGGLNSQERIENVALEGIIRRYTERREFEMVKAASSFYVRLLIDRERDHRNARG